MANSWPIIYGAFCWQKYHSCAASSIHTFYTSLYYSIMLLFIYSCLILLILWLFLQAVENAFVPVIKMVFCNIEVSDHFFHHRIFKYKVPSKIACVSEELNYWISPSAKQRQKPCSVPSLVYQHLSTFMSAIIGLLTKPFSVYQSGWRELQDTFLVIHWSCWGSKQGLTLLTEDRLRLLCWLLQWGYPFSLQNKNMPLYFVTGHSPGLQSLSYPV